MSGDAIFGSEGLKLWFWGPMEPPADMEVRVFTEFMEE